MFSHFLGNRRFILILALISFLNSLNLASVIPILYTYAKTFDFSDFEIGLLFASFALAQFLATPIIGRLSDIYGRKPLLLISIFGTFLASLLQAFAMTGWILFLGRVFDGLTGGNNSVAQAVISDTLPEKDRPSGFAIFGASFGLGFLFGPVISLVLVKLFQTNQSVYLFSALIALITTIIVWFWLPETNFTRETKKIDIVEILFLELYRAIKMPIVGTILLLNFVTSFTIAIFNVAFQPYLVENLKLGQKYINYVLIVTGIINILFIGLVKIVTDRFGLYKVLNTTFLLRFVSFGLIVLFSYSVTVFWISTILFALSSLLGRPVISSLLSKYGRPEDQGVILGSAESLFSLGLAVGPLVFGLLSLPKKTDFAFFELDGVTNLLHILASKNILSFLVIALISLVTFGYSVHFTRKIQKLNPESLAKIDF